MPAIGPTKRRDLIAGMRRLGFTGPYSGGKHQFMRKGARTVRVPNPHQGDISRGLLVRILQEAGIEREEWERA